MSVNVTFCHSFTPSCTGWFRRRKKKDKSPANFVCVSAKAQQITGLMDSSSPLECDILVVDSNHVLVSAMGPIVHLYSKKDAVVIGRELWPQMCDEYTNAFKPMVEKTMEGKRLKFSAMEPKRHLLVTTYPIRSKKRSIGAVIVMQPSSTVKQKIDARMFEQTDSNSEGDSDQNSTVEELTGDVSNHVNKQT